MKKYLFLIGMILLLVPAASLKAQDKPQPPPPPMNQSRGMMMMHNRLNLTADQRSKMQDLRLQLTKDVMPLRSQIKEKQASLKLLLTADKYDASAVSKTVDQISTLQKQVRMKMINHMRAVRNMLTPDQQKKFDMMVLSTNLRQHRAMMTRGWSMHNGRGMMWMGHGMMRNGHGMMWKGQGPNHMPGQPMPPKPDMNKK